MVIGVAGLSASIGLLKTTLLVTLITMLSRMLGLVREMSLAWQFGMSGDTDALSIAMSIPNNFYSIIGISITTAFVPLMAKHSYKSSSDRDVLVSEFLNLILVCSLIVCFVFGLYVSEAIDFVGRGMSYETKILAEKLSLWSLISVVFLSLIGALTGVLNYYRKYYATAMVLGLLNVIIIFFVFALSGFIQMKSAVYGMVVGSVIGFLVLFVSVLKIGVVYNPLLGGGFLYLKEMMGYVWPIVFLSLLSYFYIIIDYRVGSELGEGVITALSYANRFIQLPQGVFVTAIATVIFPKLSDLAVRLDYEKFSELMVKSVNLTAVFVVPSVVVMVLLADDFTEILFLRGEMDHGSVSVMADLIIMLAIGVPGFCLNLPLIRAFYAFGDKLTPLYVAIFACILKYFSANIFADFFGYNGLALSTSLVLMVNAAILFVVFNIRCCRFANADVAVIVVKVFVSSGFMFLFYFIFNFLVSEWVLLIEQWKVIKFLLDCFVCLVAYVIITRRLGLLNKIV